MFPGCHPTALKCAAVRPTVPYACPTSRSALRLSYDRFIDQVAPGGIAVIDSSLIAKRSDRTDIRCFYVPAAEKADTEGLSGLSNNILLGKALQEAHFASLEAVEQAVAKCVPPKKQHLLEPNIRAIKLGMSL